MENIRVKAQGRKVWNGSRAVELYDVIADTERFGANEIMYQGDFDGCMDYLKREGYDYTRAAFDQDERRHGGRWDIQIANTMWRVAERYETLLYLKSRDGREKQLSIRELSPVAPDTFRLSDARRFVPYQTATVKIGAKKIW